MVFAAQEHKAFAARCFWGLAMGSLLDDGLRCASQITNN